MARILVVEDDESTREALRRLLVEDGHGVFVASDGVAAKHWFGANEPADRCDLIVTDVYMPDLDGLGFLLWLKSRPRRPRVIAMSGAGLGIGWSALTVARALGADATLAKPFHDTEFLEVIRGQLDAIDSMVAASN